MMRLERQNSGDNTLTIDHNYCSRTIDRVNLPGLTLLSCKMIPTESQSSVIRGMVTQELIFTQKTFPLGESSSRKVQCQRLKCSTSRRRPASRSQMYGCLFRFPIENLQDHKRPSWIQAVCLLASVKQCCLYIPFLAPSHP
jgi:hypothetical protein